jgi:hypothetical protein
MMAGAYFAIVLTFGAAKKGLIKASTKASASMAFRCICAGKPSCTILLDVDFFLLTLTEFISFILVVCMAKFKHCRVMYLKTITSR